ncbi:eukaryotic translation initiation factor 3 subunit C-like isoform X2 [Corticium candelabrum]|uniref:eukaryotic translation initiation factor 3 subunit C-like isoform X2 n=1 Tax=Corticium candelabrum TaxID=121492 RepID=UPI002E273B68|nr:eukaryotic translation initiation factor 3 subunit C-like isoform X2 [Corticium candelabrum]
MSRFFRHAGSASESSSASSDDEDVTAVRTTLPQRGAIYLSDEEEDVKRVVKSQKDKRYDELVEMTRAIRNSRKINDVAKVTQGFDNLCRAFHNFKTKGKSVIQEDTSNPRIFIKALAELEDFVQEMWESRKKLSKNNAKALPPLKQRLRKYNKDFEEDIAAYRKNPESEPSGSESEQDAAKKEQSEQDEESDEPAKPTDEPAAKQLQKVKRESDSESDSEKWLSSSDSETEEETEGRVLQTLTHTFFLKNQSERTTSKKRERKVHVAGVKDEEDEDDKSWKIVPPADSKKDKALFAKDAEITHAVVIEKMNELVSERGRRGTDRLLLSEQLQLVRQRADQEQLGPALSIKLLIHSIICIFDYNVKVQASMETETWQLCLGKVEELLKVLISNQDIQLNDNIPEESENIAELDEPLLVKASYVVLLERLDDEFVRILQNTDAHSTDYIDRLTDEPHVVRILEDGKSYIETKGTTEEMCRIYLRVIEHLYYKVDKLSLHSDDRVDVDASTTVVQSSDSADCHRVMMDSLCRFIYSKDTTDRIRTRALLCNVYHLALHGHWYDARDLIMMSHLQESIQHSDVPTQVLYNRTIVQLGLCAFRKGLIKDAHNTLQDIQSSGKAKELLAQGLMSQKFSDRTPEQEKVEKRRQIPFHMHINLELLECVYLTCAMLLEIPNMASHVFDYKKRMISKSFHYVLRVSERSPLVGPPESMREHVVAAATAMRTGDWQACRDYMLDVKVWNLFLNPEKTKEMLTRKIQEESLRTYIFTYSSVYDSLSLSTLSEMFELPPPVVHRILSKMMISEELQASWDEPTQSVTLHHAEPTCLQSLALQLADKVGSLVENNERIMDNRYGGYWFKQTWQGQQQSGQSSQMTSGRSRAAVHSQN